MPAHVYTAVAYYQQGRIDNALFGLDQTRMLYGDAQAAVGQLIQAVKAAG